MSMDQSVEAKIIRGDKDAPKYRRKWFGRLVSRLRGLVCCVGETQKGTESGDTVVEHGDARDNEVPQLIPVNETTGRVRRRRNRFYQDAYRGGFHSFFGEEGNGRERNEPARRQMILRAFRAEAPSIMAECGDQVDPGVDLLQASADVSRNNEAVMSAQNAASAHNPPSLKSLAVDACRNVMSIRPRRRRRCGFQAVYSGGFPSAVGQ